MSISIGLSALILAFVLLYSPGIAARMDGVEEDNDIEVWLMSKPLHVIILMQVMVQTGAVLLPLSAMLIWYGARS